jgi:hypothetical protein
MVRDRIMKRSGAERFVIGAPHVRERPSDCARVSPEKYFRNRAEANAV